MVVMSIVVTTVVMTYHPHHPHQHLQLITPSLTSVCVSVMAVSSPTRWSPQSWPTQPRER
jgi:hypothetical protein